MNKPLVILGGAAVLAMGLPAVASAHNAVVTCDQETGRYIVTPDYLQFNPVIAIADGFATVSWSDGFVRRFALPMPCEAPLPEIPEVVPPPVVTPPPPVVAPTCAELKARYPKAGKKRQRDWGCVVVPGPDKPKRKIVKRYYPCVVGGRSKVVITVTLPSGKVGRVVKYGKVCRIPAVTG